MKQAALVVCALAVVAMLAVITYQNHRRFHWPMLTTPYQAVTLTNGAVFYGRLDHLGSDRRSEDGHGCSSMSMLLWKWRRSRGAALTACHSGATGKKRTRQEGNCRQATTVRDRSSKKETSSGNDNVIKRRET